MNIIEEGDDLLIRIARNSPVKHATRKLHQLAQYSLGGTGKALQVKVREKIHTTTRTMA